MNIKQFLLCSLMLLSLCGCYEQKDIIFIQPDGSISFETEVIITEKDATKKEVEKFANKVIKQLELEGWQIKANWVSKSIPYQLKFIGHGNIKEISGLSNTSSYFNFEKIKPNLFRINFKQIGSDGSFRRIRFKSSLGGAKVVDELGERANEFQSVLENRTYTIKL